MRAVSSWSLHRTLGRYVASDSAVGGGPFMPGGPQGAGLPLLDLPAALRDHGYDTVQLVHFHLPARDPAYLTALRAALADAGVTLDTLLIDDGALGDGDDPDAIEAWVSGWLAVATALGATRARVMVSKSAPSPALVADVAARLRRLAAAHPGVRLLVENWSGLSSDPESVTALLAAAEGDAGLLFDFGNWRHFGEDKYAALARIAPLAETCHAKCHFTGDDPDAEDYTRCLRVLADAGYTGPLALIYDGPNPDEWTMLDREAALVRAVFPASA